MPSLKTIFLLCCTAASASLAASEEPCPGGPKHYRATLRHIEAGGIGYNQGYTTLETFLAPDPGAWRVMPFLDARGHVFNDGKWAANAGIGARTKLWQRAWGVNAYYDYRNTNRLHYNQVGVGLETLGVRWDLRMNGYLPVGNKITSPYGQYFDGFSGHYMLLSRKYQFAMKGADAEAGFHFGKCDAFSYYAAIGPYYFIGPIGHNAWGGKARASCSYKDYITLEISDSYDSQFHNRFQGQISFTYPFGGKPRAKKKNGGSCKTAEALACRMLQPVGRDEIIVVNSKRTHRKATDPVTGDPLYFVFVDNTSSSAGTYSDPYPSLALAQANSSPGDIIYVFPGDGTTKNMNSGIALQADQKFWGSGVSHSILTGQGEVVIPSLSASAPKISSSLDCVQLSTNNEVSGFTIAGAGGTGITTTVDPQSVAISYCTIDSTNTGINIHSNHQSLTLVVEKNSISNTVGEGILSSFGSVPLAQLTFTENSISHSAQALFIDATGAVTDCNATISKNSMTNNLNEGVMIYDPMGSFGTFTATVEDNMIVSNVGAGFLFSTNCNACTIDLISNNISDNGNSAIVFAPPTNIATATFTIANNMLNGAAGGGNGIEFDRGFTTLNATITGNIINDNTGSGIVQYAATAIENMTISSNKIMNNTNISSNAAGGIALDLFNTMTALISTNSLSNNTGGSIIGAFSSSETGLVEIDLESNVFLTEPFEFDWNGLDNACVIMNNNKSTSTYTLNNSSGFSLYLSPSNAESLMNNTGVFSLTNVTIAESCP